ncbi:Acyl-coenzyme A thioesterase 8 [Astathelohania contejeani]|uniref:Acyl-coenzyme A thioesterase 8 n=1 Tax=Astathelohania contejeani TaxID=164912 RepID=A0ABQ7HVM7_9MICR|nr:Acyl-coenzyme A thioesterase 8 [Thelohania contejeani]
MDLINTNKIDKDMFQSINLWSPKEGAPVYGGQIIAQALDAALKTLDSRRRMHSLHAYFHRPGNISTPITYSVERLRDGKTLSLRRVIGTQLNKTIFTMEVSFKENIIGQPVHKSVILDHPTNNLITFKNYIYNSVIQIVSENMADLLLRKIEAHMKPFLKHFEIKVNEISNMETKRYLKIKIKEEVGIEVMVPILALLSDFFLIESAMLILNMSTFSPKIHLFTSIDHNLYLNNVDVYNNEVVYSTECIQIGDGMVLCMGYLFNTKNELIGTSMQEGMLILKE